MASILSLAKIPPLASPHNSIGICLRWLYGGKIAEPEKVIFGGVESRM